MKMLFSVQKKSAFRLVLAVLGPVFGCFAYSGEERPNVLLIMVGVLGYGDLRPCGAKDLKTPRIDRLTTQGMRFTDFYANCYVCSPTRASLLSRRRNEFVGTPGVVRAPDRDNWGYLRPDSAMLRWCRLFNSA